MSLTLFNIVCFTPYFTSVFLKIFYPDGEIRPFFCWLALVGVLINGLYLVVNQ